MGGQVGRVRDIVASGGRFARGGRHAFRNALRSGRVSVHRDRDGRRRLDGIGGFRPFGRGKPGPAPVDRVRFARGRRGRRRAFVRFVLRDRRASGSGGRRARLRLDRGRRTGRNRTVVRMGRRRRRPPLHRLHRVRRGAFQDGLGEMEGLDSSPDRHGRRTSRRHDGRVVLRISFAFGVRRRSALLMVRRRRLALRDHGHGQFIYVVRGNPNLRRRRRGRNLRTARPRHGRRWQRLEKGVHRRRDAEPEPRPRVHAPRPQTGERLRRAGRVRFVRGRRGRSRRRRTGPALGVVRRVRLGLVLRQRSRFDVFAVRSAGRKLRGPDGGLRHSRGLRVAPHLPYLVRPRRRLSRDRHGGASRSSGRSPLRGDALRTPDHRRDGDSDVVHVEPARRIVPFGSRRTVRNADRAGRLFVPNQRQFLRGAVRLVEFRTSRRFGRAAILEHDTGAGSRESRGRRFAAVFRGGVEFDRRGSLLRMAARRRTGRNGRFVVRLRARSVRRRDAHAAVRRDGRRRGRRGRSRMDARRPVRHRSRGRDGLRGRHGRPVGPGVEFRRRDGRMDSRQHGRRRRTRSCPAARGRPARRVLPRRRHEPLRLGRDRERDRDGDSPTRGRLHSRRFRSRRGPRGPVDRAALRLRDARRLGRNGLGRNMEGESSARLWKSDRRLGQMVASGMGRRFSRRRRFGERDLLRFRFFDHRIPSACHGRRALLRDRGGRLHGRRVPLPARRRRNSRRSDRPDRHGGRREMGRFRNGIGPRRRNPLPSRTTQHADRLADLRCHRRNDGVCPNDGLDMGGFRRYGRMDSGSRSRRLECVLYRRQAGVSTDRHRLEPGKAGWFAFACRPARRGNGTALPRRRRRAGRRLLGLEF